MKRIESPKPFPIIFSIGIATLKEKTRIVAVNRYNKKKRPRNKLPRETSVLRDNEELFAQVAE